MKVVLIPASSLKSVLLNYPMSPHPANIRMKEGEVEAFKKEEPLIVQ
jgi:hypothetical protein